MQIRTLWQPVRKARVRIPCQILLFDIWLLMATALSSPSLGPHTLKAHGICLTCGLCCYSDQAQEVHTLVWFTDTESSCKYSFFSLFVKRYMYSLRFSSFMQRKFKGTLNKLAHFQQSVAVWHKQAGNSWHRSTWHSLQPFYTLSH